MILICVLASKIPLVGNTAVTSGRRMNTTEVVAPKLLRSGSPISLTNVAPSSAMLTSTNAGSLSTGLSQDTVENRLPLSNSASATTKSPPATWNLHFTFEKALSVFWDLSTVPRGFRLRFCHDVEATGRLLSVGSSQMMKHCLGIDACAPSDKCATKASPRSIIAGTCNQMFLEALMIF